jgi:hypothetical protein
LASIPLITVFIPEQKDKKNISLNIENLNNIPAFELDIWLISTVYNDDYPKVIQPTENIKKIE